MKIQVVKKVLTDNQRILVEFNTPYGATFGNWIGAEPELFKECHIEFEIPDRLIWGSNISESELHDYKIWSNEKNIVLNVKLESYDDDHCLTVRLGDSLILVETQGTPFTALFLSLRVEKINIYPFDI